MAEDSTGLIDAPCRPQRVLGSIVGSDDGPTMIVTAGLHGNEPAGIQAVKRLVERLEQDGSIRRGRLLAFAGNLTALEQGVRYVDRDLNRIWMEQEISGADAEPPGASLSVEPRQRFELLEQLKPVIESARGPVYFLDLHTSSADGPPFLTVGDTMRNRRFARGFPLPLILGLEEQVDGALLEYLNNFGLITMGVEAGQHDAPGSVDRHEAVLWLALVSAGMLSAGELPDFEGCLRTLSSAGRGVPPVIEVRYRHAISPTDGFRMQPGYRNFRPVRRGELLGEDRDGPIHAPEDGMVLLPLYQGKGDDGFFVAREVRLFWLRLSGALRRLRVSGLLRLLPGVRRDPRRPEVLTVDTRIARWYPLEIFHLFGYRKLRSEGSRLSVSRRRYDLDPPDPTPSVG